MVPTKPCLSRFCLRFRKPRPGRSAYGLLNVNYIRRKSEIMGFPYHSGSQILEMHVRDAYERCHPGETFQDLKTRARFSEEDRGLLSDWITFAGRGHQ